MYQSKLVRLLKLLTPDEFRHFYKFIRSIYFQNNANVVKLYVLLRKYYPDFHDDKMDKKKVFKHLFPERRYKSDTLASLMTKMTKVLEEYLLVLDLEKDSFEYMVNDMRLIILRKAQKH
ncbi:MAG: hypothetical protein P1U56_09090 [Saprospiraceae bacterium]|nr:hypothetical protein [Saprospiraceae bacterium]